MPSRAQAAAPPVKLDAPQRGLAHPLESLVFLVPLLVVYEVGSLRFSEQWAVDRQDHVVAFQLLRVFFELFGTTGKWMPALAVVAILVGAQIASRKPWRVSAKGVLWIAAESLCWAVPLVAVARLFGLSGRPLGTGGIWPDLVICIGAGVYEELVFRLILICLIVMVGSDLLRAPAEGTTVVAVILSALAFAAHHHPPFGSQPFDVASFGFRTTAGLALGALFVRRGYGIAAGTHVFYNMAVVALAY